MCWHKWEKWKVVNIVRIVTLVETGEVREAPDIVQEKVCKKRGFVKRKKIHS